MNKTKRIIQCPVCHKYFEGYKTKKYCSKKCRDIERGIRDRAKTKSLYAEKQQKKKERKCGLNKKNPEAKRQGKTYAQLQAEETLRMYGGIKV